MSEFFRIDTLGVEKYWEKYYWAGFSDSEGRGFHSQLWHDYFQNDAWQRLVRTRHFERARWKTYVFYDRMWSYWRAYEAVTRNHTVAFF